MAQYKMYLDTLQALSESTDDYLYFGSCNPEGYGFSEVLQRNTI